MEIDRLDSNLSMHGVLREVVDSLSEGFNYLEIGFGAGASMKIALEGSPSEVVVIDPFEQTYGGTTASSDNCRNIIQSYGADEALRLSIVTGRSRDILPTLSDQGHRFGLCLIDGDHSKAAAEYDLQQTAPLVRPGGFLVFDDIYHRSHMYLFDVWEKWVSKHPEFDTIVTYGGHGCGLAQRRTDG